MRNFEKDTEVIPKQSSVRRDVKAAQIAHQRKARRLRQVRLALVKSAPKALKLMGRL